MSKNKLYLGRRGEKEAIAFLEKSGYKVIESNYRTKLGEIDIIASEKNTLCFIEVKTRSSLKFGLPAESVSGFKQKQISKAALSFLKQKNLLDRKARIDIVSVTYLEGLAKFDLIKNAFEISQEYVF